MRKALLPLLSLSLYLLALFEESLAFPRPSVINAKPIPVHSTDTLTTNTQALRLFFGSTKGGSTHLGANW